MIQCLYFIIARNGQLFLWTNKIFRAYKNVRERWCRLKNEQLGSFRSLWNKLERTKVFLLNEQIFGTKYFKTIGLLLNKWFFHNKLFYWTNDFTARMIYWTIVHWANERNRWKINNIFKNGTFGRTKLTYFIWNPMGTLGVT